MFDDEKSKNVFLTVIYERILGDDLLFSSIYDNNQYFCLPKFHNPDNPPNFIDCGGYCGDTVERFLQEHYGNSKNIYVFEPGNRQFIACSERIERLKKEWALTCNISLEKSAISKNNESFFVPLSELNSGTSLTMKNESYGTEEIKCTSLDLFFKEIELKGNVLVKADVEGQEMNLLYGATDFIKRYKPLLTICLYHKPKDFFEIPIFIKEIVPEYKFMIRHHSYSDTETVLYCYI